LRKCGDWAAAAALRTAQRDRTGKDNASLSGCMLHKEVW
jgi:hypothetical protein